MGKSGGRNFFSFISSLNIDDDYVTDKLLLSSVVVSLNCTFNFTEQNMNHKVHKVNSPQRAQRILRVFFVKIL